MIKFDSQGFVALMRHLATLEKDLETYGMVRRANYSDLLRDRFSDDTANTYLAAFVSATRECHTLGLHGAKIYVSHLN